MGNQELKIFKEEMKKRTKKFAHDCVKFAIDLPKTPLGNHIRGQLIRCSTSVAANYRAACLAQTVPLFISKISIVIEEADECEFWIGFSIDEQISVVTKAIPLIKEAHEIAAILIKSRQSLKSK